MYTPFKVVWTSQDRTSQYEYRTACKMLHHGTHVQQPNEPHPETMYCSTIEQIWIHRNYCVHRSAPSGLDNAARVIVDQIWWTTDSERIDIFCGRYIHNFCNRFVSGTSKGNNTNVDQGFEDDSSISFIFYTDWLRNFYTNVSSYVHDYSASWFSLLLASMGHMLNTSIFRVFVRLNEWVDSWNRWSTCTMKVTWSLALFASTGWMCRYEMSTVLPDCKRHARTHMWTATCLHT